MKITTGIFLPVVTKSNVLLCHSLSMTGTDAVVYKVTNPNAEEVSTDCTQLGGIKQLFL
jgi:hypothetical protein